MSDPQTTPTEEEITRSVAALICELGLRGKDQADKTRIVFSAAVNSIMLFICTVKLLTGKSTENCRKQAMELINETIEKYDSSEVKFK